MDTHMYKVVDQCAIKLDVYPSERPGPAPVLVWIHGGALITGGRAAIAPILLEPCLEAGFAIVAIDYRLAPETKLPLILEDLKDAFAWVRGAGAVRFGYDPRRLGAFGHSAGGYLTLMSGFLLDQPPQALVSLAGYGDVVGDWYSRSDPFYSTTRPMVSREQAYAGMGGPPLSEVSDPQPREIFYLYCRQQGLWPQEVMGMRPDDDPSAFYQYCPERNVAHDYPPTLLLHGTADTDVPHQRSVDMAAALRRAGATHELVSIPDGAHGFFRTVSREDLKSAVSPSPATTALRRMLEFFKEHVAEARATGTLVS